MKKILLSAALVAIAGLVSATNYYSSPTGTGKLGNSWDQAVSIKDLTTAMKSFKNGDTIFVKGGTITLSAASDYWFIKSGITLIGGFDPNATGTVTSLPKYPSATPTIISGDVNKNGKPDQGDASTLIRVDLSQAMTQKVTIQGFDLINTYYSDPTESTKDIDSYLFEEAAVRVICGTAYLKNCNMYKHVTPSNRGSQCLTVVGANVHMMDCDLHDCVSLSRGALVRGRQFFIGGKESDPIAPSIVIERCALHHASNMAGDAENTNGAYGGAVHMSAGEIYVINSTFICDSTFSKGGAIRTATDLTVVSSTFAQNYSGRAYSADSKPYAYGSSFGLDSEAQFRFMNTIMVDDKDDGKKKNAPFYTDGNTYELADLCVSGGYNILGTMYAICNGAYVADQSDVWLNSDITSPANDIHRFSDYFSSVNDFKDNGGCSKTILPKSMQPGASKQELQDFVDEYFPEWTTVDVTVDQRNMERDANVTCVGAAAYENGGSMAVDQLNEENALNISNEMFNVLGQRVDAAYKGIILQSGRKYLLQ